MKFRIIEELEEEKSQRLIVEQFKYTKSMISDIWRARGKIKKTHVVMCELTVNFQEPLRSSRTSIFEVRQVMLFVVLAAMHKRCHGCWTRDIYKKRLYTSSLLCIHKVRKLIYYWLSVERSCCKLDMR